MTIVSAHTISITKKALFVALSCALACASVFYIPSNVQANGLSGEVLGSDEVSVQLDAGEEREMSVVFKNTGASNWDPRYVSIITVDPIRRRSFAYHPAWNTFFRPAVISGSVAPGESTTVKFKIRAPEFGGLSEEYFQLANAFTPIPGTKFTIHFGVQQQESTSSVQPYINDGVEDTPQTVETNMPVVDKQEPEVVTQKSTSSVRPRSDYPVRDDSYFASEIVRSFDSVEMKPGETKEFRIGFKNVGTATWKKNGSRFVSVYTVQPNYHVSPFVHSSWYSDHQITMETDTVRPGQIGYFSMLVHAPKQAGSYVDYFRLAAEDYSWVKNGAFGIAVTVSSGNPAQTSSSESSRPSTEEARTENVVISADPYQAFRASLSSESVTLAPGERATFKVGFKNTGASTWLSSGRKFVSLYTWAQRYRSSAFFASAHSGSWMSPKQIRMDSATVAPGEIGYFSILLNAPGAPGSYTEQFMLAAEDTVWIPGGLLEIPITVTDESGASPVVEPIDTPSGLEPMMRVGLFSTTERVVVTASGPFNVYDSQNTLVASMSDASQATVTFNFSTNQYQLDAGPISKVYSSYLKFVPVNDSVIMEVANYERRAPWKQSINFNRWRGALEVRYADKTGKLWVINEIPMESYLKGIAETSNASPVEFLKVMSIAARTYATYHYQRQTKHADEHFYVDSDYDQVYRGYTAEMLLYKLSQAVDETRGIAVHYDDKIAITPYFSQSDGRTRSWGEVWGGSVAWAQSVPVPHDNGKSLLGHGVGMSARGALLMIMEDGKSYDEVLKYFYNGIDLVKMF